MSGKSSRLSGFYKLNVEERASVVAEWAGLDESEKQVLMGNGLTINQANHMIENVVGTYSLPMGIACNFQVNGKDYLVPMVVEEPSVVAAISNAARAIREGGGFHTQATDPIMIGQLQVLDLPDMDSAVAALQANQKELLELANCCDELVVRLGGGARELEFRPFPDTPVGPMLIVHLMYDVRDAMGANTVNTAVEAIAPRVAELTGGRTNLRILSNLASFRLASARATVPASALATEDFSGPEAVRRIAEANAFAVVDPYRAATHNKGIMNGIDAVVIATGNDWRAIEAGAHAYAAYHGRYSALTDWHVDAAGDLYGEIKLPMAVGTVGGATRVHPSAKVNMKILNVTSAGELAQLLAAVGLAQNLAALRALATVGIQQGHMRLHARQVALAAGATGPQIEEVANQLVAERKVLVARAEELLREMKDA